MRLCFWDPQAVATQDISKAWAVSRKELSEEIPFVLNPGHNEPKEDGCIWYISRELYLRDIHSGNLHIPDALQKA